MSFEMTSVTPLNEVSEETLQPRVLQEALGYTACTDELKALNTTDQGLAQGDQETTETLKCSNDPTTCGCGKDGSDCDYPDCQNGTYHGQGRVKFISPEDHLWKSLNV